MAFRTVSLNVVLYDTSLVLACLDGQVGTNYKWPYGPIFGRLEKRCRKMKQCFDIWKVVHEYVEDVPLCIVEQPAAKSELVLDCLQA